MKHNIKITVLLVALFFITQLIGLLVLGIYSPKDVQVAYGNTTVNTTTYHLPYGMDPPADLDPKTNLFSIVLAIIFAVVLMFVLMKYRVENILRIWFLVVVTLAVSISINAFLMKLPYSTLIAIILAVPIAILKIFKRGFFAHNLSELLIYPGIAALFVPLLSISTAVVLLIFLSIYDMYAVWHAKFMQKMAKYQIKTLRLFSGFFIPYAKAKDVNKGKGGKKVQVQVAILGGGDVVFPIILAGTVLHVFGFIPALIISIGATFALTGLFYMSEKGKFYPAMPFISVGCFIALILVYLIY